MWFTRSIHQTLDELKTDPVSGLTEEEAAARLTRYGPNVLKGQKRKNFLQLFIAQLNDTLIYVLFGAVFITSFMGEYIDAVIILLVIIINAALGVIQEIKAGNAIDALRTLAVPKALVKRNGVATEIDSERIVPGDLLVLEAGRSLAADVRLIESVNLQIEESALTGESVPAEKEAESLTDDPDTPLADRNNMAYKTTLVTYGRGLGIAVETGMKTEVGKIAGILDEERSDKTPLEKKLDTLGKNLGKIAIGVCLLMFGLGWLQGRDLADMFLTSVSLAVASIPEGLAAIVAVVLSIGVTRMARQKAIVKKLPAVETLGSVSVVCSDKTGTLTQNKMTVVRHFNLTEGEVDVSDENRSPSEEALELARALILSSDATYENGVATGDPTEIAFLIFGDKLGIDRKKLLEEHTRESEFPFDSDRKMMSTLQNENGYRRVFTKGAIDQLIEKCTHVKENGEAVPLTEQHKIRFREANDRMAGQALRTLAAAYKPVERVIGTYEMEKNLILIGIAGMIDPPRNEVKDSIAKARKAGITPVMITGDHKNTALAIARELGIAEKEEQAITGSELNRISEEQLQTSISDYKVFARVSPEHKVRIVRAFKSRGNIVAMTGDGVNDAPSLNTADIGVAMGVTGTDVAKNASDMILADDNFATIVSAIEQGRNIYNNIKKSVIFLLASNMGEVVAMVTAILLGLPAPLIATQLLWINLLTDTLPAVALGMDPRDPDVMKQKPRDPAEGFFARDAVRRILLGGFLIGLLTLTGFWFGYYEHGYSPFDSHIPSDTHEYARTMAFMTIVSCQLLYSFTFRHPKKSVFQSSPFANKYLVGAVVLGFALQLLVMGIPFMQKAFRLQMLDAAGWINVLILGLIPVFLNEVIKFISRMQSKNK